MPTSYKGSLLGARLGTRLWDTHANSDATKIFYFLNKTAYISVFGDLY